MKLCEHIMNDNSHFFLFDKHTLPIVYIETPTFLTPMLLDLCSIYVLLQPVTLLLTSSYFCILRIYLYMRISNVFLCIMSITVDFYFGKLKCVSSVVLPRFRSRSFDNFICVLSVFRRFYLIRIIFDLKHNTSWIKYKFWCRYLSL